MKTRTVYAIPSLGRPKGVLKAIRTLTERGVNSNDIFVFVVGEEYSDYKTNVKEKAKIVVGRLGIGRQRTFINAFFNPGTRIVSCDDDIELITKDGNRVKKFEVFLPSFVKKAFDLCDELGIRYWGVPETTNGMFMKHQTVLGLRQCCGSFYGEYAGDEVYQSIRPHCEDLEKMLLHYDLNGGLLRFDDVGVKQKRYAEGGVNAHLGGKEERITVYEQNVMELVDQFPALVSLKKGKRKDLGLSKVRIKTKARYGSILESL